MEQIQTYGELLNDIKEDCCTRFWVLDVLKVLETMDPVDALDDLEVLQELMNLKLKEIYKEHGIGV